MKQENPKHQERTSEKSEPGRRKPYKKPDLIEYGSIVALTHSMGGTVADGLGSQPV